MLFSRMFALALVLMMMGAGGADANAGAFEDDYTAYDEALGVMEVRTPAAKKQKQLDYSTDDDEYGVYEITDDGDGDRRPGDHDVDRVLLRQGLP